MLHLIGPRPSTSDDVTSEVIRSASDQEVSLLPDTDLNEVAVQTRERVGITQAHQGDRHRLCRLQQIIQKPGRRLVRRPAGRLLRCTALAL